MILLVPLRAEGDLPRLPRVTLGLIVLNLAVFVLSSGADTGRLDAETAKLERIADWTLRKLVADRPELGTARQRHASAMEFLEHDAGWRTAITDAEARDSLSSCFAEYQALIRRHPFHAWGLVPAQLRPLSLVSHQFLHADLLHLFFNMLFLWVVGGVLEASWGAPLFAAVDLLSGLAAALAHVASAPDSPEPAIGASGAVAGLMGALAVAHGRRPIRIAMVSMLAIAPRISFLSMPAALLFGLWLVEQLFWALLNARLGIAFWAHIGGFGFGAAVAFALRRAGHS